MPLTTLRALAIAAFLCACTRTAGGADTSHSAGDKSTASTTANGSVAPLAMPHDSISDRADRGRILGDSTATLWVIMASDFQCPFCKQWHDASFPAIVNDFAKTGKIRLAFLNMPLNIHPHAVPAAEAAMCASVQDKFWPMHDALFATQNAWESLPDPSAKFDSLAAANGVNMALWRTCVSKHLTLPLIQADRDRAQRAGVGSTPTFFVGTQMLAGADADVHGAIAAALKR